MKTACWFMLPLLCVGCTAALVLLRADEPKLEVKTEARAHRFQIQRPVDNPDGSIKLVREEVTKKVPVPVPTGTAPAIPPAIAVSSNAMTAPAYVAVTSGEDAIDEESQKLFEAEKAAAAEAKRLSAL